MFYIIYLSIIYIFLNNLKILKFFIIGTIFFLFLIGFSFFQNFLINNFFHKNNRNNFPIEKTYSIVILGGNYLNRVNLACKLVDEFKIINLLIIKDDNEKKNIDSKKIEFFCFNKINLLINKSAVNSTKDDVKVIKENFHILSKNVIIITDGFHVKRTKYLVRKINKDFYFYSYNILPTLDYKKNYSIFRGLFIVRITLKEIIAIFFEKINV